jgi:hypothetical protein
VKDTIQSQIARMKPREILRQKFKISHVIELKTTPMAGEVAGSSGRGHPLK